MKLSFVFLALLLIPSALAAQVLTELPATAKTGEEQHLKFFLFAEKNYSTQHIDLTITTQPNVLLKGCNGTYSDDFYVVYPSRQTIDVPILFSTPGQYTITYSTTNTRENVTRQSTIAISGPTLAINEYCAQGVGNRKKHYGYYENNVVKDRIKNTVRKYAIW